MPDKIYWDACVLLSWINGYPKRVDTIGALFSEAQKPNPEIELVTSTLSIVEVAFGQSEQTNKVLDLDVEEKINNLWRAGSPIRLVEFHELVAEDAKQLMRAALPRGASIKPADAIHLSTAKRMGVKEFHTYDQKLKIYEDMTGLKIVEPYTVQQLMNLNFNNP